MADALDQFNESLQQDVLLQASAEGGESTLPETFTHQMLEILTEAGEVDTPQAATYEARGARASAFELSDDGATLHVLATDYHSGPGVSALGRAELDAHMRRLTTFVDRARGDLWQSLEESSAAWDMARHIQSAWRNVGELRLTLLTNSALRTSVPGPAELDGRTVRYAVWDLTRLQKLDSSGRTQEPISVDVVDLWGGPIPCLGPHGEVGNYEAYLLTLPGQFLAAVYEIHGPRLLELNVRSFLQARGKVNRGIQETITAEPGRFLAYNNGISMTAAEVEVVDTPTAATESPDRRPADRQRRPDHGLAPLREGRRTRPTCRRSTCRRRSRSSTRPL